MKDRLTMDGDMLTLGAYFFEDPVLTSPSAEELKKKLLAPTAGIRFLEYGRVENEVTER
jgi:hypothetical protein